jgi:phosphate:Na+ symporter
MPITPKTGSLFHADSHHYPKEVFRDLETRATEAHFGRIRAGRMESVETSSLHLDLLRDLKRINAHVASAAYAVLEKRRELLSSRLRQDS